MGGKYEELILKFYRIFNWEKSGFDSWKKEKFHEAWKWISLVILKYLHELLSKFLHLGLAFTNIAENTYVNILVLSMWIVL